MDGAHQLVNPHLEGGPFLWEAGPVGILLSHGYTATSAEVRPLARRLHAAGYTVKGLVLPGHGTQPADANRYRWGDWLETYAQAYRELAGRCEQVFVGGESLGGVLSLYFASEHPEIAGILAYAPALGVYSRLNSWLVPLLAPFVPYRPKPNNGPSEADALWQGYPVNPLGAAAQLFALQRVVRRRLPFIRRPLFIAHGRRDATVPPAFAELAYRQARSTLKEIHWLERSGHCVILDCERETVADLTLKFIERALAFDGQAAGNKA